MRAHEPDREGYVESHGTRIFWEEHGAGERTVMLIPPWQIVHSRMFKMQVPYLARYFRVLTFDPPGNGRSGRPAQRLRSRHRGGPRPRRARRDRDAERLAALQVPQCLARRDPRRATIPIASSGSCSSRPALDDAPRGGQHFHTPRATYDGWQRFNAHYWREHFEDFLEFFFDECFPEPHSTKPREDGVSWGRETTPDILIATMDEYPYHEPLATLLPRVHVPTLIIHGDSDRVRPLALAERAHAAIAGSDAGRLRRHGPRPRRRDQPVRTNLLAPRLLPGAGPVAPDVAAGAGAAEARPLRLEPDRPRPRAAGRRDRARAARAPSRRWRSTGSPRTR